MEKCKIITLSNQKGGVGKTTTTYTLALGLVKHGYKVLGVDLDPQRHFTRISNIENAENTICNCFRNECITQEAMYQTEFGFSLLPGDLNLAGADYEFHDINREFILRNILKQVKDNYDYIVIDTPPNLGVLTINALVASNEVIIPVESGELALEGFEQFFKTYRAAKKYHNPNLIIAGILINMYRKNVNLQREYKKVLEEGCKQLGIHLFDSTIRLAADVENMRNERKSILDSKSEVSKAVMNLQIQIPNEMIKELIPDMNYFKSEFERWLTKEDYWSDVTRAKTDFVITKDYNHKKIFMTFFLNDHAKTEVQVTYDYNKNKYEFNQV